MEETTKQPKNATLIFIFGLSSIVICAPLGIVAWVMGSAYMKQAREMGVKPEGLAVAGKILGIIGTVFLAIGLLIGILAIIAAIAIPFLLG